jgi:acyl-CoA dehydrogenase
VVFDRPIGQNQGVQFPIARAHIAVESADLMRRRASARFDAGVSCGAEANMAKLSSSKNIASPGYIASSYSTSRSV